MKTIKVDFSKVTAQDLNGKVYSMPDANKDVGNALFVCARTIELADFARSLHSGKETKANKEELEALKQAIETALTYLPIAVRAIIEHIDNLIKEL